MDVTKAPRVILGTRDADTIKEWRPLCPSAWAVGRVRNLQALLDAGKVVLTGPDELITGGIPVSDRARALAAIGAVFPVVVEVAPVVVAAPLKAKVSAARAPARVTSARVTTTVDPVRLLGTIPTRSKFPAASRVFVTGEGFMVGDFDVMVRYGRMDAPIGWVERSAFTAALKTLGRREFLVTGLGQPLATIGDLTVDLHPMADDTGEWFDVLAARVATPTRPTRVTLDKDTLAWVADAAGTDDVLPVLMGVHVRVEDGTARIAATDRYRLHVVETPATGALQGEGLVPAGALLKAVRAGATTLALSDRLAVLSATDGEVIIGLIEGTFPAIDKLIPDTFTSDGEVDPVSLLAVVKRAGLMADPGFPAVVLSADAVTPRRDKENAQIPGLPFELPMLTEPMAFNVKYLSDALAGFKAPVMVGLTTGTPIVFRDGGRLALVMPMRLP